MFAFIVLKLKRIGPIPFLTSVATDHDDRKSLNARKVLKKYIRYF